jgi:hypothetical protein
MYLGSALQLGQVTVRIDVERAVARNRHFQQSLGWHARRQEISRLLGFANQSPGDREFAEAVASWQARQGLSVDGILGPNSWRRMSQLLQPSQPAGPSFTPSTPAPPLATFARARHEIDLILANPSEAQRWGVPGTLLSGGVYRIQIQHPGSGAANQFRRTGFQGFNKCNLFVLDLAWRAGFRVPLLNIGTSARPRYSYPLANSLTTYAERMHNTADLVLRGTNRSPWGTVHTTSSREQINSDIARGALYILTGWRRSGTGHVGILGEITSKTDGAGSIREIVFNGWEATSRTAEELTARRWRTTQQGQLTGQCQPNPQGTLLLHAFYAIHIIRLEPEPDPALRGVLVAGTNRCRLR